MPFDDFFFSSVELLWCYSMWFVLLDSFTRGYVGTVQPSERLEETQR